MNVSLTYNVDFTSLNVIDDILAPNIYHCKIKMLTNTDNSYIQNVSFDRLKFFFNEVFDKSVLIKYDAENFDYFLDLMPFKIVALPEDSFDQIIGLVLYCKLNAIMNNNVIVEEIQISSKNGGDIWYQIDANDNFTSFKSGSTETMTWWSKEDLQTNDIEELDNGLTWDIIGLNWEEDDEFELIPDPSLINKIDSEDTDIIIEKTPKKSNKVFSPTIVSGGKS